MHWWPGCCAIRQGLPLASAEAALGLPPGTSPRARVGLDPARLGQGQPRSPPPLPGSQGQLGKGHSYPMLRENLKASKS